MKKMTRRFFCLFLSIILGFSATGCAKPDDGSTGENNNADPNIVNIGVTDPVGTINPLLMDATEIVKYSSALQFLPLCELNSDLEFEPMLAS
ncbi:MAG: ABC transporter substrate-binding protein, partial [Firmicutes bacterium]|nr:ABC transporter substrate-binding protein [Bacillota bacterium]